MRYEYMLHEVKAKNRYEFLKELNELGKQGWRVAHCYSDGFGDNYMWIKEILFQRGY